MVEGSSYYPITYFRSVVGAYNIANPNVSGLPVPGFMTGFFAKRIQDNVSFWGSPNFLTSTVLLGTKTTEIGRYGKTQSRNDH